MILTTPIKQPCTITKHNNKSYIFTLYLFMLLCVVSNCLLFYCSCTGNCENCCGINGNASVSGGIISVSVIENENRDDKNKEEKQEDNKEEKQKEKKEEEKKKEEKKVDGKEEKKEEKKIEEKKEEKEKKEDNKIEIKNKLEEVTISAEGKIDNIQIVKKEFVNLVKTYGSSGNYEVEKKEFLERIKPTCETHLSAYVEVEDNGTVKLQCFINCTNANSIGQYSYYGLFEGSEATKIEILSCGSEITNMNGMFCRCSSLTILDLSNFKTNNVTDMSFMFDDCSSLTILDLSNFNTNNVTNMSFMFYYCSGLTKLDLSKFNTKKVTNMSDMFANCHSLTNIKLSSFNTTNVTDMSYMFAYCGNLTELNLSSFNADTVKDISYMFNNCFKNKATLICKASTIQKITDNGDSCLIITNEKKAVIKKTIENNKNPEQVYTCSVNRVGSDPEITGVKEYQSQQ